LRKLTAGLALAVVVGLALAGCTKASSEPTTPASSVPAVDPSRVSPTDLPTPPVVKDAKGAVRDLTLGECKTDAGDETVSGSLTSSQSAAADFLVSVSWTNATGDVMGRGYSVLKKVAPGQTVTFEIKAKVAAGATQCVKGVEYGTIAS
jgi:hypothetical protein